MDRPWETLTELGYGAKCSEMIWLVGSWDYWLMLEGQPELCYGEYRMNLEKQFDLHQKLRLID